MPRPGNHNTIRFRRRTCPTHLLFPWLGQLNIPGPLFLGGTSSWVHLEIAPDDTASFVGKKHGTAFARSGFFFFGGRKPPICCVRTIPYRRRLLDAVAQTCRPRVQKYSLEPSAKEHADGKRGFIPPPYDSIRYVGHTAYTMRNSSVRRCIAGRLYSLHRAPFHEINTNPFLGNALSFLQEHLSFATC